MFFARRLFNYSFEVHKLLIKATLLVLFMYIFAFLPLIANTLSLVTFGKFANCRLCIICNSNTYFVFLRQSQNHRSPFDGATCLARWRHLVNICKTVMVAILFAVWRFKRSRKQIFRDFSRLFFRIVTKVLFTPQQWELPCKYC